jgi:hypothetical protein
LKRPIISRALLEDDNSDGLNDGAKLPSNKPIITARKLNRKPQVLSDSEVEDELLPSSIIKVQSNASSKQSLRKKFVPAFKSTMQNLHVESAEGSEDDGSGDKPLRNSDKGLEDASSEDEVHI